MLRRLKPSAPSNTPGEVCAAIAQFEGVAGGEREECHTLIVRAAMPLEVGHAPEHGRFGVCLIEVKVSGYAAHGFSGEVREDASRRTYSWAPAASAISEMMRAS